MNFVRWNLVVALGTVLITTQALAQPHERPMQGQSHAADQDMKSGMDKMNRDMGAAPMTGDADRDFVAMMIPHHQGAIDMAQTELRHGKDPGLRRLATDIVAAQRKEIAMMRRWQAAHQSH
jgi:uncharacterized protein (DUF305 family)